MLPLPVFFGSKMSADGRGLWHNFLGYCRVTRRLPKFFLICYMVYFNKIKSNLGGLSCTRGPSQPMDYRGLGLPQEKLTPGRGCGQGFVARYVPTAPKTVFGPSIR